LGKINVAIIGVGNCARPWYRVFTITAKLRILSSFPVLCM